MPEAKRVSWAQLRIGVMAAFAMAILGVLIFLLTGSGDLFRSDATLYTYMDDSAAMATSTPVRLNGILVGKIEKIEFSGEKTKGRIVKITMSVRKDMLSQIPIDSSAGVDAANLLGDKYINIEKGLSPTPVKDGGELKATLVSDIPELMNRAGDMLGSFNKIVGRLDTMLGDIEQGKGNVGKLIKDEKLYNELNATIIEARTLITNVNHGKGILPRLINDEQFAEEIRSPIKRMDTIMADLQSGQGTMGKLLKDPAVYDEARATIADVRRMINVDMKRLLDDLNEGRGTAGKLLKDDALYKRIDQLVANINGSLDKLNSGQGTLGQLMVNQQLYDSLNGATREAQALLKDIRANPKKFLRIKLGLF